MTSLLYIDAVSKTYPSGFTLKVDRLRIEPGERVGLVGNNGAGKTTLMLLTLDLVKRDAGKVRMNGVDIRKTSEWRRQTASYLGESSLINYLTPYEYLSFVFAAYGLGQYILRRRLKIYESFLALPKNEPKKLIREFSTGSRKKIGIAAAMMVRPSLLLLDEPFAGLDPRSQAALLDILSDLNGEHGTTLFISSHDLVHMVDLCTRTVILDKGRIVHDAPVCAGSLPEIRGYLTSEGSRKRADMDHYALGQGPTNHGSVLPNPVRRS